MAKLLVRLIENGSQISNTFHQDCANCLTQESQNSRKCCPRSGDNRRFLKQTSGTQQITLCSNSKKDIHNTDRILAKAEAIPAFLAAAEEDYLETRKKLEAQYRRLFHNISALNAHIGQELYLLADQASLQAHVRQQKSIILNSIRLAPNDAATAFVNILKHNAGVKTEIDVFQKLFRSDGKLTIKSHKIHMALLNNLHVFFQDFLDNDIQLQIAQSDDFVLIDFDSVRVAFHHFFLNASKFIAPSTVLSIDFLAINDALIMTSRMISTMMEEVEIENLYNEGISGKHAIAAGFKGDGIGLGLIREIMARNDGSFSINAGATPVRSINNVPYAKNEFVFFFKRHVNRATSIKPKMPILRV